MEDTSQQVESGIAAWMECVTVNIIWKILHSKWTVVLQIEWSVLQWTLWAVRSAPLPWILLRLWIVIIRGLPHCGKTWPFPILPTLPYLGIDWRLAGNNAVKGWAWPATELSWSPVSGEVDDLCLRSYIDNICSLGQSGQEPLPLEDRCRGPYRSREGWYSKIPFELVYLKFWFRNLFYHSRASFVARGEGSFRLAPGTYFRRVQYAPWLPSFT